MKKLLWLIALSAAVSAVAQDRWPKPSSASRKYHEYRIEMTEPTFGLAKVKAIIAKIKPDSEENQRLTNKRFNSLSFEEKFTFTMIHAEDFAQNCDVMPPIMDEQKKIFAFTPDGLGEEQTWSDRQRDFLTKNRAKVIALLRSTIRTRHRVGANLKQAIELLDANELIPDVIAVYRRDRKDHDILTMLMLLMKDAKYKPFLASGLYAKLYADEGTSYKAFVAADAAHERPILDLATAFSKSKK
ncbi:MAG TPA: hypothetical protein VHE55_08380 [Fimbriimonadaceae bacterium]|nr:hypothetical protein [Fimbriimonadaceae bacterium]